MRILLAEDENDLNNIISRSLTAEQYSVDSCFDGEDTARIEHIDSETLEATQDYDCPYECRRQGIDSSSQKLFEDYDDTKDVFNSKDIK